MRDITGFLHSISVLMTKLICKLGQGHMKVIWGSIIYWLWAKLLQIWYIYME
jgi:hypothetical protein